MRTLPGHNKTSHAFLSAGSTSLLNVLKLLFGIGSSCDIMSSVHAPEAQISVSPDLLEVGRFKKLSLDFVDSNQYFRFHSAFNPGSILYNIIFVTRRGYWYMEVSCIIKGGV